MSVYVWGANSHGQLGLGYESELCMSPQLLRKSSFAPVNVRCIRGGGGHVLVLDSSGKVHACGWNNHGQLGLDSDQECHNEFQCIPGEFFGDEPVDRIGCGWDISGCITVTKKLFLWGSNSFQQLGICQRGFNSVRRPLAVMLPRGDTACRISFGLRHCAILTEDHKVYIFGRLRIDSPPTELVITTMSVNRAAVIKIQPRSSKEMRIMSVASGQNHLLLSVLDLEHGNNAKHVLALGDNKFGQSKSFHFEKDVKQMVVGWTHNAVLLKDNRIFLWGRNSYGQLGTGSVSECEPTPVELKLPKATLVPKCLHLGSEHALLRFAGGAIYTWGWNEHGNCGSGSTDNLYTPKSVDLPANCRHAGTGAGFCYAVCDSVEIGEE